MRSVTICVLQGLLMIEQKGCTWTFRGSFQDNYYDKLDKSPLKSSARIAAHLEVYRFKYL
jgi:hypothetical protein